ARVVAAQRREPHRVGGQTRYLPCRPSNLDSASPARPGTRHGVAAGPVGPALITPAGPRTNHPARTTIGLVSRLEATLLSFSSSLGSRCHSRRLVAGSSSSSGGARVPVPAAGRGRVASVNAPTG